MAAPVNFRIPGPTVAVPGWDVEEAQWLALNKEIGGNPDFYPLTVKGAYVVGVVYNVCLSVSCLLRFRDARRVTYIPAYGVAASGIELLGRCINGNRGTGKSTQDLQMGFQWLASSSNQPAEDTTAVVTTEHGPYSIDMLVDMRHFAAHGQAMLRTSHPSSYPFLSTDFGILAELSALIADGLERYWNGLVNDEDLCNRLARAGIVVFRDWPVITSWGLFERTQDGRHRSITELFREFDWRV